MNLATKHGIKDALGLSLGAPMDIADELLISEYRRALADLNWAIRERSTQTTPEQWRQSLEGILEESRKSCDALHERVARLLRPAEPRCCENQA